MVPNVTGVHYSKKVEIHCSNVTLGCGPGWMSTTGCSEMLLIDARDREQLARNNITHILSIHDTAAPILQEMTYLCIPAADAPTQNLIQHFKKSIMFMHESRLKGEGCLVHCVTLVVAYIMTVTTLGWQEALAAVKVARPCASPNAGFQTQLQVFESTELQQFREWLKEKYKENPFNDEEEIRNLLTQVTGTSTPEENDLQDA
ncbi:Dual specificity protein phosphatase 22-B [Anabarilius grahami]|uniref:Dual specificity protein phosphatase 15 n=1 Tax=Anabarilius grahami TaxID=495550 RepID=A0A3N0YKJ8_ANAGA|nr:Dual specificity protein phosphatase 22-B [Anabarilius grahami]